MNVRFADGVAHIKVNKRERDQLSGAMNTLRAYARATDSDEQREALEKSVEEIGKVLASTSEEAALVG